MESDVGQDQVEDRAKVMEQALRTAYHLGIEYWQQAVVVGVTVSAKSIETASKLEKLIKDTCASTPR